MSVSMFGHVRAMQSSVALVTLGQEAIVMSRKACPRLMRRSNRAACQRVIKYRDIVF